ncbi:MAG TPA: hypothetical protein VF267_01920, partial [Gammaproteobacteria bacterium]
TAQPLSEFLLDALSRQVDLASIEGRAKLVDLARPLVEKIPDAVYREMLHEKLGQLTRMDSGRLGRLMGGAAIEGLGRAPTHRPVSMPHMTPVRRAVLLLMHQPRLALEAAPHLDSLRELDLPGAGLLVRLVEFLRDRPEISMAALLEHWRENPDGAALHKLAGTRVEIPEDGMAAEFRHVLDRQLLATLDERRADASLALGADRKPSEMTVEERRAFLEGIMAGKTVEPDKKP